METQALDAVSATVKTGTGKVLVEKRDGRVVDFDPVNIVSRGEVRVRRPRQGGRAAGGAA